MKVVSIGNMAADGLLTTMALRKVGVDAELIINSVDFACAFPFWELKDFGRNLFDNEFNPYGLQLNDVDFKKHKWINILDLDIRFRKKHNKKRDSFLLSLYKLNKKLPFVTKLKNIIMFGALHFKVRKLIDNYDIVEAHVPYGLHLQLIKKPYMIYEAGWMGKIDREKNKYNWFEKKIIFRSYEKAKGVINTNPYIDKIFKNNPVNDNINFIPFAVDTDRYKPMKVEDIKEQLTVNNEFLVLGMARQNWDVKGSDRLIKGFYIFHKQFPDSRLLLMKWGMDLEKSMKLIRDLGIYDNVSWLPFMPKSKLILIYNAVDVACDQFIIGGWGTSYPECMATATPVLLYHDNIDVSKFFGSLPPTQSVRTAKDISDQLIIYKKGSNKFSNKDCRDWIIETHNMTKIGNMHKQVLEDALNG